MEVVNITQTNDEVIYDMKLMQDFDVVKYFERYLAENYYPYDKSTSSIFFWKNGDKYYKIYNIVNENQWDDLIEIYIDNGYVTITIFNNTIKNLFEKDFIYNYVWI